MPSIENIDDLFLKQIAHWYSEGAILNPDKLIGNGEIVIQTSITPPGQYQLSGDAKILHNRFKIISQLWNIIDQLQIQKIQESCGNFNLENSDIFTYFHHNDDFPDFPKVTGIWKWNGEIFECERMMIGRKPGDKEIYYIYVGEWFLVRRTQ